MMMERRFDLAPDYRTFAMLLPKLCLMHSLELFHYAYNDMKMHSYVPTKRLLETILLSLCDSNKHWIHSVKLLEDVLYFNYKALDHQLAISNGEVETENNKLFVMAPTILARLLQQLIEADEEKTTRMLYQNLTMKREYFSIPLNHNSITESCGIAAIRLNDANFLSHLLWTNVPQDPPAPDSPGETDLDLLTSFVETCLVPGNYEEALALRMPMVSTNF